MGDDRFARAGFAQTFRVCICLNIPISAMNTVAVFIGKYSNDANFCIKMQRLRV